MKTLLLALTLFTQPTETETLSCTVQPLSTQGFIQVSGNQEYICANPFNKADFIIIEDPNNEYNLDDSLYIMLDKDGDITSVTKR